MVETFDHNDIGERSRRRRQFAKWLLKAWLHLLDRKDQSLADEVAIMLDKADEMDYPLWGIATKLGIIGNTTLAAELITACGIPTHGPVANNWERAINFSPVIKLDEKLWDQLHSALGWANKNTDATYPGKNFWLLSAGGNVVRFVVKESVLPIEQGEDDAVI